MSKLNIQEMIQQSAGLPNAIPDFEMGQTHRANGVSAEGRKLLTAFAPLLDSVDWQNEMVGAPDYRKHFETTAKLVMAQMLRNVTNINPTAWQKEATLAGTDIPTYARQMIKTILRAYPRLFAVQLFGVVPFSAPDARVFYYNYAYNSAFAGSVPNIADADRTDDLTKFNKDFFQINQNSQAGKIKFSVASQIVTVLSYRVTGEWSYEAEDDMQSIHGEDVENALIGHMADMLGWVTDRTLVEKALADVPAGNKTTWDSTAGGAYAAMAPSEKKAYDETLYTDGILSVINKIQQARAYNLTPNWAIAGPNAALALQKLVGFKPVTSSITSIDLFTGGMRDLGALDSVGVRVLVDPQMTTGKILFGRRPVGRFDPGYMYCPYRPLRTTGMLETPGLGKYEKGVYTRFGVAAKDGGVASSSQLADVYGELTIS